jgi:hypothetical protein
VIDMLTYTDRADLGIRLRDWVEVCVIESSACFLG